jgi:phage-related minor tail protein
MAGKAIRGITVEIGGNTTKLDKALAGSEKKSRSLQVELREVTKLLKFDPTNTELLAQKQEILKGAISETGEKLKILKEAQAQVVAQFERGEIGEDQYRAFQREIMQTENALGDMRKELKTTEDALKKLADGTDTAEKHTDEYKESVEKAKKELDEFKASAEDAFNTVKTGAGILGGAMIATGGYALKLSTDFDKAFNTLVTRTGASADEMDELNEAMERVYANNFGDSIQDVAESMATVRQNTKLSGDELQKATERALLLRDTFEFDVNESTRTAKMLMDQYGLSADEAYNLIAQGAQKGLDKNGDLLDTINEYSVHFNNLGLGAEDMFNMLVNGAENGTFSVDKLGDAVKEFGIRAKDGSDSTADAFAALGLNADETSQKFAKGGEDAKAALDDVTKALFAMDDPLAQNQVGVALFGTMWEDLGVEGVKALMGVEGEISKTSTALEDINNQKYDDIGSALQGLGRTIETDVVKPLGEELKPVVEEAIEYVKENGPQIKDLISEVVKSVGEFVGWIVDNGDLVISTIVAIGTGLLVWNVASMINSVVGAIKAYKLANEGATIAQALFNAVLNANPIMLIVTLIVALVAGIVTFIATNDEARAKFVEIWNKIKETAKSVLDAIVKFFKDAWAAIKKAWDACVTFFSGLWTGIKNTFSSVGSWFKNTFSNAWTAIKNVFSGWGEFFSGLWTKIKNKFSDIGANIATAISGSVKAGINGVIGAVESIINKGIGLINGAITLANKLPGVSIGQLGKLSLPRLAKGGIVNRSTVAEIGEDGREAVLPLEKNTGWMKLLARELTSYMRPQSMISDGALLSRLDRIYDRLNRLQVVLDSGELVGGILDPIDEGLSDKYNKTERGW